MSQELLRFSFRQPLVELFCADAIGVALDIQSQAGMREIDAGELGQCFARIVTFRPPSRLADALRRFNTRM
jgi:hypothetical protein